MITLVFSSSFKRAFKNCIKRKPDLKPKIEEKLRLLAEDPYNPILRTHKLKGKLNYWELGLVLLNTIAVLCLVLRKISRRKRKKFC